MATPTRKKLSLFGPEIDGGNSAAAGYQPAQKERAPRTLGQCLPRLPPTLRPTTHGPLPCCSRTSRPEVDVNCFAAASRVNAHGSVDRGRHQVAQVYLLGSPALCPPGIQWQIWCPSDHADRGGRRAVQHRSGVQRERRHRGRHRCSGVSMLERGDLRQSVEQLPVRVPRLRRQCGLVGSRRRPRYGSLRELRLGRTSPRPGREPTHETLMTLNFVAAASFSGSTQMNVNASAVAAGFTFFSLNATIFSPVPKSAARDSTSARPSGSLRRLGRGSRPARRSVSTSTTARRTRPRPVSAFLVHYDSSKLDLRRSIEPVPDRPRRLPRRTRPVQLGR